MNNTIIKNNSCFNKKTGNKISCMIVVHVFGHMCEMEKFQKISKQFKIPIIEDAAEAVGSLYNGKNLVTTLILLSLVLMEIKLLLVEVEELS